MAWLSLWLKKSAVYENPTVLAIPMIMDTQVEKPLQSQAPLSWGSLEAVAGLIDMMADEPDAHILPQLAEFQRNKLCYYHYYLLLVIC